ncbi:MAG TPA: hypothetical protein VIO58_10425 [Candidatus Methanoperedens sp.]
MANIGSNPAYSVSVIIPDQRDWRVSGPSSIIIGNLNSGDYTVAGFKLQSPSSTAQNMTYRNRPQETQRADTRVMSMQQPMNSSPETVEMQIAYTDTMGERKIVDKQVNVEFQNIAAMNLQTAMQGRRSASSQDNFFLSNAIYLIGLAVLATGFVTYRKYRYQKFLDPDFKIKDMFRSRKK